jgi:hypothetical protein
MADLTTTPIRVSVHRKDTNPVHHESAIHVELVDEGGGPFISLLSLETSETVSMDIEELEAVVVAARGLMDGFKKEQGDG